MRSVGASRALSHKVDAAAGTDGGAVLDAAADNEAVAGVALVGPLADANFGAALHERHQNVVGILVAVVATAWLLDNPFGSQPLAPQVDGDFVLTAAQVISRFLT